jgi:hypothetical protein
VIQPALATSRGIRIPEMPATSRGIRIPEMPATSRGIRIPEMPATSRGIRIHAGEFEGNAYESSGKHQVDRALR